MTCAVILAGGLSRRMGGQDKSLADLNGTPLIGHVIARIAPQVDRLAVNAHAPADRFAELGLEVIADPFPDHPGPLAGVLAALGWAKTRGAEKVLTVPTDCPFLPADLFRRLDAIDGLAVARSVSGLHPVCALWPVGHEAAIREALIGGTRRMREVTTGLGAREVVFGETPDPFFNVNTPADLKAAAERM
jgi:molybdopterin-guanine dinucleotide biosynthesis protein A